MKLGEGQRALAVGAHPDDVEYGCSATLQRFDEVLVLVLTAGEHGGPAEDRRAEAAAAAGVLGASLRIAEHTDTAVTVGPAITTIAAVIGAYAPDVVFCPSRHDDHQDHAAVGQATYTATRRFPGLVLAYLTPSAVARFAPQVVVGVDERRWATKLAALAEHRSQSHRAYLAADHLDTTARYWGQQADAARAEPFEVLRWVVPG